MTAHPDRHFVTVSSRSQHQNRAQALQVMRSRLYEVEREKLDSERSAARKGQIGSGDRSERIRTYNYPQGRVTDHRINLTLYQLDKVLSGDALDELIEALITDHQATLLAAAGELSRRWPARLPISATKLAALLASTSPTAALDARLLVAHVLDCTPNEVLLRDEEVAGGSRRRFEIQTLARRRIAGEPIARIVGEKEFYGPQSGASAGHAGPASGHRNPRRCWLACRRSIARAQSRILDLGTGSGAILLALLSQLPNARGLGIDISEGAVAVASANALRHGLSDRAEFAVGDWADGIVMRFDVVVANPPYIATSDIAGLPVEVRDHDPHVALDGGADGLDAVRVIISGLDRVLADGGAAFIEIGFGQAHGGGALARAAGSPAASGAISPTIERVAILSRSRRAKHRAFWLTVGVAKNALGNQSRTG